MEADNQLTEHMFMNVQNTNRTYKYISNVCLLTFSIRFFGSFIQILLVRETYSMTALIWPEYDFWVLFTRLIIG